MSEADTAAETATGDFIRDIVRADLEAGRESTVVTRFPPEPNGYLHIGHAKSMCLNFGVAGEFGGRCHLRFDDTNPVKEEIEYIEAIKEDVRWLGFDWGEHLYFASDNFERLYEWAEHLIQNGKAYVDDLTAEEIREHRGTLTEPGRNSPYRDRPVDESLDLFRRMRAGEFPDGARVLRAKIDMASGNINLRDPVLYRILHAHHPRTGDAWSIYPTYDFAHGQSDAIEGVTHSLCTLEFEDHRPLYNWLIENLPVPSRPYQYEFARLNLSYTVLSKRRLIQLVEEGHVAGWNDPRMPTLTGLRRRGIPAAAIRDFIGRIGVAKADNLVDMALLEHCVRELLNTTAQRRMAVLRPLKVVIENYPEGESEMLEAVNNPRDESAGTRQVPFSREIYIERDDFMEDPPKKFFRLAPGREVRLRFAFFITCTEVVKDAAGEVVELRCTYDPATRGGDAPDGRKVKGTIHWVSAAHAISAELRLYDHLFAQPVPGADGDVLDDLNPDSLEVLTDCRLEPALAEAAAEPVQFERTGYFTLDPDATPERLVFNRTVGLRDSWAKVQKKGQVKTAQPEGQKVTGSKFSEVKKEAHGKAERSELEELLKRIGTRAVPINRPWDRKGLAAPDNTPGGQARLACVIFKRIKSNFQHALAVRAMVSYINQNTEFRALFDNTLAANGLNIVYRTLLHDLIIILSRLYDSVSPTQKRGLDRASMPHLMHLLEQQDIRNQFLAASWFWTPGFDEKRQLETCTERMERARASFSALLSSEFGSSTLRGLKWFRDVNLAHTLFRGAPRQSLLYGQIGELLDRTSPIIEDLALALRGEAWGEDGSNELDKTAKLFWGIVATGMSSSKG